MADSYEHDQNACTSSTSTLPAASSSSPPDEISLFLQQILLRTSSSAAHGGKQAQCSLLSTSPAIFSELTSSIRAFATEDIYPACGANVLPDEISAVDSSEVVNSSSSHVVPSGSCRRPGAANASFTSVGVNDENENDDFDCESEEGLEALVEEPPTERNPRSSSKRSRAAEVHNLSEKRRRSRINEKMKALQNLIPNSNKTDKASMLDEAIEYLKQLQLQVQMLWMRNGLSLHPLSLPENLQCLQLSQMRTSFNEEKKPFPENVARPRPCEQEQPTQIFFGLPQQRTASNQFMPDIEIVNVETPFDLESSIRAHLVPFHLNETSKDIWGELQDRRVNVNRSEKTESLFGAGSPGYCMPAAADLEKQNGVSVEACIIERNHSGVLLKTSENNPEFASYFNG